MFKAINAFIFILVFYSGLFAQNVWAKEVSLPNYFNAERIADIDAHIKKSMLDSNVPGAAIALIESGEIVHMKGFGIADSKHTPVSPQTPFQLASITKSFTSLIVLQMEKEGKLKLSDSLIKYIPWFETAESGQAKLITIRHLLQHNSGLSTLTGNQTQNTTYRGKDATERAVKKIQFSKLASEPGTEFHYSNANYHLLTYIIELLEGKPFESIMSERILHPLNMHNSYVQISNNDSVKEAIGFPHWFGQPVARQFILGRMKMGDGGLVASAEDLAKFLLAIATVDTRVLTRTMRDNLFNAEFNSSAHYGLGWEVNTHSESPLYEHSGANGGFSSWYGYAPENEQRNSIGFIILSNSSSALYSRFNYDLKLAILGEKPKQVSADQTNLISLILLYGGILIMCFMLYRTIFKFSVKKFRFRLFLVPALLFILCFINALYVPSMFSITLLGIYPFFPDLAVGLIMSSVLSFFLATFKIIRLIRL